MLLQPTDNNDRNDTLDACNSYRNAAPMNRILTRTIPQPIILPKRHLVALKLAMHIPSTTPPPQHRPPLARNPAISIRHDAAVRAGVEERLVLVRERDVDDDGRGDGQEPRAQRGAKLPGIVGGEVLEDERRVDARDGFELRDVLPSASYVTLT